MVGLNFFFWAFICHVSAFATVQAGSFSLAAVHFSLTWLIGFGIGPLLDGGLSFACVPGR